MSRRDGVRTNHYWQRNHGTAVPHELCFVQVKTQEVPAPGEKNCSLARLDLGVADFIRWDEGRAKRWQRWTFAKEVDFWTAFHARTRSKTSPWLIGHGIARAFTLLDGWSLLDNRMYSLTPSRFDSKSQAQDEREAFANDQGWLVDNDPPTILMLYGPKCIVHVVDIQNYGEATLEELALEVGLVLPEIPRANASMEVWETWLTARVQVVRSYFCSLLEFWRTNDCGRWRHTFGGLSMSAYRHKFLTKTVLVHDNEKILEMERAALAGGEFRTFYCGKVLSVFDGEWHQSSSKKKRGLAKRSGPIYTFDCNSLYPSVMRKNNYPTELMAPQEQGSIADLEAWGGKMCLCANVCVETVSDTYPLWFDQERYWAVGKFWTTLCGPELDRALFAGHIKSVGMIAGYWPGELFTDFVDYFHDLRTHAPEGKGKVWSRFCKLLMNALAGKCAQRAPQWEFDQIANPLKEYGTFPVVNADTGEIKNYRAISGHTMVEASKVEGYDSVPIVSAFVNAYAREYMRKVLDSVGRANVFYMGSDSLHIAEAGLVGIQPYLENEPGELGKFRSTGVFETAEYRGPSDYTIGDRIVCAGKKIGSGEVRDGEYAQSNEPGLRAILSHQPRGFLRIKRVIKKLGGYHPKGILNPDGSVSPPQMINGVLHFNRSHPAAFPWQPADTSK